MNRMVGGTFGVAVLGAMVATLGRSKIDQLLPRRRSAERAHLAAGLGSGAVPHGVPAQIVDAGQQAFVYALQYGLRLGSAVALLGAVLAWTLVDAASARRDILAGASADADGSTAAERPSTEQDVPAALAAAETVHV